MRYSPSRSTGCRYGEEGVGEQQLPGTELRDLAGAASLPSHAETREFAKYCPVEETGHHQERRLPRLHR